MDACNPTEIEILRRDVLELARTVIDQADRIAKLERMVRSLAGDLTRMNCEVA